MLEIPLNDESIRHTLKVAYGSIVRERRRYFRHSVDVPVVLGRAGAPEMYARTRNVSECGMALSTSMPLPAGLQATVQFTLPDPILPITADCRVCWSKPNGDAGLSFSFLPYEKASELQAWLARKLEQQLPQAVTDQFR